MSSSVTKRSPLPKPTIHFLPLHPSPPSIPSVSSTDGHDSTSAPPVPTAATRTSLFRGVTRHRWTGRYEAHLWDNTCKMEGQKRKGRQVYLGGYDNEEKAAKAYDLAALKYWGLSANTNYPASNYYEEMEAMKNMSKLEFVASIRRKSSGFSRGASIYRGVTRHHQHGRWQARIGRVAGNKDIYLGTFASQEEAAEAYDVAAIKFRGINAITNFELSRYNVKAIENTELPIGQSFKRTRKDFQDNTRIQLNTAMPALSLHNSFLISGSSGNNICQFETVADPSVTLAYYGPAETFLSKEIIHFSHLPNSR